MIDLYEQLGASPSPDVDLYEALGTQEQETPPEDVPQASYHEQLRESLARGGNIDQTAWRRFLRSADNAIPNPVSEFASAANRGVTEFVDAVPNAINAGLSLAGAESRVPTLTGSLEPVGIRGNFMQPGAAREVVQATGSLAAPAAAMVPIARPAGTAASLAADFIGAGASKTSPAIVDTAANALGIPQSVDNAVTAYRGRNAAAPVKNAPLDVELGLKRQSGDANTFGYMLDDAGRVVANEAEVAAGKQGLDEKVATMLSAAPRAAKDRMLRMLDIVERSKENAKFEAKNIPGQIVGESLANRIKVLTAANRVAGSQIDSVARGLKGKVDVRPAMEAFERDLNAMDIVRASDTPVRFDFENSSISGLKGPTKSLERIISQLGKWDGSDPYTVHKMKKLIDESVVWGKGGKGLKGQTARILKSLRVNLDAVLDETYPEYNRVNTLYSETIGAIDALQKAAGKRIDLTGPGAEQALGTLSRRVLGNQVTWQELTNSIDEIDRVTKSLISGDYAGSQMVPYRADLIEKASGISASDLDDGIIEQIRFVAELDGIFGTNRKNSFLGDINKAVFSGVEDAATGAGPIRAAKDGYRAVSNKVKGVNEENALKALRELLR